MRRMREKMERIALKSERRKWNEIIINIYDMLMHRHECLYMCGCVHLSIIHFILMSAYILLEIAFIHPHSHRNYILTNVWEPLSDDDDSTSHDYYYYGLPFLHTQTHTCARTLRFESIKSQPNCQLHLKLIIDFCISDVYIAMIMIDMAEIIRNYEDFVRSMQDDFAELYAA